MEKEKRKNGGKKIMHDRLWTSFIEKFGGWMDGWKQKRVYGLLTAIKKIVIIPAEIQNLVHFTALTSK